MLEMTVEFLYVYIGILMIASQNMSYIYDKVFFCLEFIHLFTFKLF